MNKRKRAVDVEGLELLQTSMVHVDTRWLIAKVMSMCGASYGDIGLTLHISRQAAHMLVNRRTDRLESLLGVAQKEATHAEITAEEH